MTKLKKQNAVPCKFPEKFKGPLFHCREILDHKHCWSGKTLSILSIYFKTWKFFHKIFDKSCLKAGKIKKLEFQKLYVLRPDNRKHSSFITWIFYQLTYLCSNYAIQLCVVRDLCEASKNYNFALFFKI